MNSGTDPHKSPSLKSFILVICILYEKKYVCFKNFSFHSSYKTKKTLSYFLSKSVTVIKVLEKPQSHCRDCVQKRKRLYAIFNKNLNSRSCKVIMNLPLQRQRFLTFSFTLQHDYTK